MSTEISLILCIVAAVLLVVVFIGTFVPVLPGAPLAWAGLLAAYFSQYNSISILCLVITELIAVVVSITDNFFPVTMTKNSEEVNMPQPEQQFYHGIYSLEIFKKTSQSCSEYLFIFIQSL